MPLAKSTSLLTAEPTPVLARVFRADGVGVALSGHGADADRGRRARTARRFGADDYLAKPFHFPELVLRVAPWHTGKPATHSSLLGAAGVELDAIARTATPDGRRLELSAKELAVLEALL